MFIIAQDVISLTTSDMAEPSFTVVALRMLFDISFFIIVTALGLNIVIAILVDHFTELRQERVSYKANIIMLQWAEPHRHTVVCL